MVGAAAPTAGTLGMGWPWGSLLSAELEVRVCKKPLPLTCLSTSFPPRKIVAEYEKTIAQMIGECRGLAGAWGRAVAAMLAPSPSPRCLFFTEDEQRTNMTSQKNLQQLTMEKDQALADLNSVERSLSDLFRRYENLKGVLEGFKKVRTLVCCAPAALGPGHRAPVQHWPHFVALFCG